MESGQTTIGNLFNGRVQFIVPDYQRAYSWEERQIKQFLDDIKEQKENKKYYFGHFLFETIEGKEPKYAVIDGQQRLTTIVIFMSSLLAACKRWGIFELDDYSVDLITDTYLNYHGQKFETVREDSHYFEERVIRGNSNAAKENDRKSELNIKRAADFFDRELDKSDSQTLARWFNIIHTAKITTYPLEGEDAKITATQIFSLQNDRGKELTTLEKLKAYLMHQIYKCSEDASADIDFINSCFRSIYEKIEELKSPEDTILRWHCEAFLPHWTTPFENIKSRIAACTEQERRKWIRDFTVGLQITFKQMVKIESAEHHYSSYIADICYLDKNNTMPLLIKMAHYGKLALDGYADDALKYIERILFKLTFTRGSYRTNSFVSIAKNYSQDGYEKLVSDLQWYSDNGFQSYWDFSNDCRRYFEENNWHYISTIRYVLYKYENFLREAKKNIPLPVDECSNIFKEPSLQNTLDHITPQNPNFTEYSEDFQTRFLCNIGNLSLLTWSNNSSKSNNDPVLEKEKYNSVYLAQKEIYETLCSAGKWGAEEIANRRKKILRFIFENWELGDPNTVKELAVENNQ